MYCTAIFSAILCINKGFKAYNIIIKQGYQLLQRGQFCDFRYKKERKGERERQRKKQVKKERKKTERKKEERKMKVIKEEREKE